MGKGKVDDDGGLPAGWEEILDDSGKTYYANRTTGESSWEKPKRTKSSGALAAAAGAAAAATGVLPSRQESDIMFSQNKMFKNRDGLTGVKMTANPNRGRLHGRHSSQGPRRPRLSTASSLSSTHSTDGLLNSGNGNNDGRGGGFGAGNFGRIGGIPEDEVHSPEASSSPSWLAAQMTKASGGGDRSEDGRRSSSAPMLHHKSYSNMTSFEVESSGASSNGGVSGGSTASAVRAVKKGKGGA